MNSSLSRRLIAGCGYVGFRVAKAWQKQGHHTFAVTRRTERAKEFAADGLHPIQLDLSRPATDVQLPEADVVLWAVGFDRSAGVPREKTWIDGLRWLAENLTIAPKKFLYVSSTSVYGTGHGETVDETSAVTPVTDGGKCCVAAEKLLREFCETRFPETQLTALRLAGIYGPNRLLRRIEDLQNRQPLPGEPDHWLNLIHVDDAVRLIDAVCNSDAPPDVINVVNSETLTRRGYYNALAELVNAPPPVFAAEAAVQPESSQLRSRGGNRRVISVCRESLPVTFKFDNIPAGLADAVRRSDL